MITLLQIWILWHVALVILALLTRAPHYLWQKLPHGSGLKMKLCRRVWPFVDRCDGWLGAFWNPDTRRLYVCLLPFVGVRIDLRSNLEGGVTSVLRALFGEEKEEKRVKALCNGDLGGELCNKIWGTLAMGSRKSILVGEAIDRLRSMPDPSSGIARIARERLRQIQEEDFSAENDDAAVDEQLARAAACYALPAKIRSQRIGGFGHILGVSIWPLPREWWKAGDRDRELEKAGALIAAELDRRSRRAL